MLLVKPSVLALSLCASTASLSRDAAITSDSVADIRGAAAAIFWVLVFCYAVLAAALRAVTRVLRVIPLQHNTMNVRTPLVYPNKNMESD